MPTSDSIKELATALAKAQKTLAGAKKDATNPHFKSRYADLAACWEAAKSTLPDNGLCVFQTTRVSEQDEVIVITRLAHSSGEWIEGELALPVSKADAQGYGSALTYARRYGLCAIVGIAPEDDDGNAAAAAKPAEKVGMSAKDVALEQFDRMNPEEKQWARDQALEIIARHDDGKDMYRWAQAQNYDHDEFLAIWSQLPSNVRTKYKKQKVDALSQPLAAELAGQA